MDRPRGKPKGKRDGGGRPPGRRNPPPPGTGLEALYLTQRAKTGAKLVLNLTDGRTVIGSVQEHDRDQIVLEAEGGPVVVRKSEIRYLHDLDE